MTGRHHHHHGAPGTDEPGSLPEQPLAGRQIQAEIVAISRRGFLQSALAGALAGLVVKLEQRTGLSMPYLQAFVKRIYLAPDDHTDYFWSADEATYQQAFLGMLDYYLDKVDQTLSNPPAFQSRWNCDGSFWVWEYEHHRTAQQFNRLMQRVKDGHIGVPLNALCVCLGGVPAEAVLRGMYYPGQLERRFGVRFPVAYVMENQTRPYGLGSLWVGSGAKYSWQGICDCDNVVPAAGDREHDAYWSVGQDGSRLLVKWNSKLPGNAWVGSYAEARDPSSVVDYVSGNPEFQARYPYQVIGVFGQGWDDVQTKNQLIVQAAQSKTNASRQVIVSNETDYFEDFETTYAGAANFPTLSCTFGNGWDLYIASLAEVSARIKRALEKLRAAEALATLVSLKQPNFMNGREAARAQAWMDFGLFWEHNFGMVGLSGQVVDDRINWQKRLADEIETYVNALYNDAVAALAGLINKSGANPRFFVFNPLSWARTDVADFPYSSAGQVHVIDVATGQEVPSQLVTVNAQAYLRILASDVPAVGYKIFEIRTGAGSADFSSGAPTITNGNTLNSSQYAVVVGGNGAITSLVDKTRADQEFAKGFSGKWINDLGAATGAPLAAENVGVVSATLVATVNTSSPLKHVTRITLVRGSPRIEIRNTITQNFDTVQTWQFGFDLALPDVWHEEVGAIIRAKLTTNGGHYSARGINSRYDWLTLNHFADMTGGNSGVTLSNADCYFMKLGGSTRTSLDTATPQIAVLAGGKVVNSNQGLPSQGGDNSFLQRFALQTHGAYDQVGAMKFALEHQNPLVTGAVTGGSAYPEASFSLLAISNPNVLLWALKPAEDGIQQGIVARVWNLSNAPADFTLALPGDSLIGAWHLTHIETPGPACPVIDGALTDSLNAQQLKTYGMLPASRLADLNQHAYLPVILKDAMNTGQSAGQQAARRKDLRRRMLRR